MKEVRAAIYDEMLPIIDALRGSQARNGFLRVAIQRGLRAIHEEASRNAPPPFDGASFGLAQLKHEGQHHYREHETIAKVQAMIDRMPSW